MGLLILWRVGERPNWRGSHTRCLAGRLIAWTRHARAGGWGRLCRRLRRTRRINSKGTKRFAIELTVNLESVANLIAANRGGQICICLARNLAIIKTLILERLLHALDHLIRSHNHNRSEENQRGQLVFHFNVILTLLPVAYSAPSGAVTANVDWRCFTASR